MDDGWISVRRRAAGAVAAAAVALATGLCAAGDWPQYRGDAARSGYTAEDLPGELTLQWVRPARHAPARAWVGRSLALSRMKFDWAYSVVVADGTVFFGSSADDKVTALDAATGREKWSVFTGGPVRLAPAVADGRVVVGSDDGYVYCLSAADGRELWKLRAGPSGEMLLGNGRMVSRWVVRGGPAVADGVVYFAAGAWPLEGTYVCAADSRTGKIIWCNDETGALEIDQPHMVCFARGGVAAQGYLAVSGDTVFVATGRSIPAAFDRKTGKLKHFNLSRYGGKTPWGVGGGDVVAAGDVFVNCGIVFDSATGLRYRQIGERQWWAPKTRDGRRLHGEFNPGQRQVVVATPEGFVRSEGKAVFAAKLGKRTYEAKRDADTALATPRLKFVRMADGKHHVERIADAPVLKDTWQADAPAQPESMIVAGKSVVLGMNGLVAVMDRSARKITWRAKVDGPVRSLAVADGRLYASTDTGTITCFGKGGRGTTVRPAAAASPYPADGPAAKAAAEIVRKSGITTGYCLDLDCGDGALAYELARQTKLHVVALAPDAATARRARRKLDAAGVYGVRVSVLRAGPADMPDYFANLIVSSSAIAPGAAKEISRIQRPFGGVVCTGAAGKITVTTRGPLKGAGQWTHNLGDAGNTMNSGDSVVAGPLGMLWYRDETQETIDRHGKNPAPLACKGLLLREGIDSVTCTDAYNGTVLWEVPLPGVLAAYVEGTQIGAGQIGSTFCVADDVLYVRKGGHVLLLNVFTGRPVDRICVPPLPDKSGRWGYVACKDGILYGSVMNEKYVIKAQHGDGGARQQKPMGDHLTESRWLFAYDTKTRKLLWMFKPEKSIRNTAIAVGAGLVYVIDRDPAEMDTILRSDLEKRRRGGKPVPAHPTGVLLALDARTGKVRWKTDKDVYGTTLAVSTAHDVLLMGYNKIGFARPSDRFGRGMRAYQAASGKVLWASKFSGTRPAIVGRTIYSFPGAWDLLTGKVRTVTDPKGGQRSGDTWQIHGKGQGCGLVAGSENLLMLRSAAIGYYDLSYDRGWLENYGGIRAGCFINALPACGIVLVPDDTRACRCSYQNQATIALTQRGVRPPEIDPQPGQGNFRLGRWSKEPLFTGTLAVVISHPDKSLEIRYTLDDSYPTAGSMLYTGPITLTKTTAVRASVFKGGRKLAMRDAVIFMKVGDLSAAPRQGVQDPSGKKGPSPRGSNRRR